MDLCNPIIILFATVNTIRLSMVKNKNIMMIMVAFV